MIRIVINGTGDVTLILGVHQINSVIFLRNDKQLLLLNLHINDGILLVYIQ